MMPENQCKYCTRDRALQNFTNLSRGQPWDCLVLYVVPAEARAALDDVQEHIRDGRSCFRVISGAHGEGKSAMLKYVQMELAINEGVCYSSILLDPDWVRTRALFVKGFLTKVFSELTLPDGVKFEEKLKNDSEFRRKLKDTIYDADLGIEIELRTIWNDLSKAILKACDGDPDLRGLAINWLKGENLLPEERKRLEVSKNNIYLSNPTPIENSLRFFSALCRKLGYKGFFLTLDEVEQLGFLGPMTGQANLSRLRDLINLQDRVLQEGCHIFYSISDWYLVYSGIIEAPEVAGVRVLPTRKPRVLITDVERFDRILTEGVVIKTRLTNEELQRVISKMRVCYNKVNPHFSDARSDEELLVEAMQSAQSTIPGKVFSAVYDLFKG